jgi:hypothetical protein
MNTRRDLERMLMHEPGSVARLALDRLRSTARTGNVKAAFTLRSLSAYSDPERFAEKRGKPLFELAKYLRRAVANIKSGAGDWPHDQLRTRIMELPDRPALAFEKWFEVAWDLYLVGYLEERAGRPDLESDSVMWGLWVRALERASERNSKGHGEKPLTHIKKRLKRTARDCW